MLRPTFFILLALVVFTTVNAKRKPRCKAYEVRAPCGTECEDRCNGYKPKDCLEKEKVCKDWGCRCRDGFYRNQYSNTCVPKEECPADGCKEGEISGACGRTCEGSCIMPTEPTRCQTISCSKRACRCDLYGGFVRKEKRGKCVRMSECPKS